jgi:hypothetical protein
MTAARTKITMIETSKIFLFREIMLTLMFFLAKGFGVDYTVFYYIAILQSSILPCILTIKENCTSLNQSVLKCSSILWYLLYYLAWEADVLTKLDYDRFCFSSKCRHCGSQENIKAGNNNFAR